MKRRPRTTGNRVIKTWPEDALLDEPSMISRRIATIASVSVAIDTVPETRFGKQNGTLVQDQRRITDGRTVSSMIRKKDPRPHADALISFATDLDRLHEEELVHWDVKPANILYDRTTLFLIDWEPSLLQYRDGRTTAVVTPAYVAPSERGRGTPTARTDRFGWIKTLMAWGLEVPGQTGEDVDDETIERWIEGHTAVTMTRQICYGW